jgi:hypothetical protein
MNSVNQSLSASFNNQCGGSAGSCSALIIRDELLNGGSTSFQLGEEIFYRIMPPFNYVYSTTHGGTVRVLSSHIVGSITEQISFTGQSSVDVSYPIIGSFSYKWLGKALRRDDCSQVQPNVLAQSNGTSISIKYPVYGILEVTYSYEYTSIGFTPIQTGKQMILACGLCASTSPTQYPSLPGHPDLPSWPGIPGYPPNAPYEPGEENISEEITVGEPAHIEEVIASVAEEDVTITITDACESQPVVGAQVTVDGVLIETVSGEDGKIHLGILTKGEHNIVVTAPGYVSSANDSLSNDSITVG